MPSNASAIVHWTASTGDTINSYTVTAFQSNGTTVVATCVTASGASTQTVVTGLSNGSSYVFSAVANGASGDSTPSSQTLPLLIGTPGVPTGLVATNAGHGRLALSWTAPPDNGSAITVYQVQPSTPFSGFVAVLDGPTSASIFGASDGASYQFTVAAINSVGAGPASALSSAAAAGPIQATGGAAPSAPEGVQAINVNSGQSAVYIRPPSTSGSSPVTYYTVVSSQGGGPWYFVAPPPPPGAQPQTSLMLFPPAGSAAAETFTVTASNTYATGPGSTSSNSITPGSATAPAPPLFVNAFASQGGAVVSWGPNLFNGSPVDGGSPITGYTITVSPGGQTMTAAATASTATFSGLNPAGGPYTFTVTTQNSIGSSAPSQATSSITLPSVAIQGHVMNGTAPVPGRTVAAICSTFNGTSSASSQNCLWSSAAETNADGAYSLLVAPGRYDLYVTNDSLASTGYNSTASTVVDVSGGAPAGNVTIQAVPASVNISGSIANVNAGAGISVFIAGQSGSNVPLSIGAASLSSPTYSFFLAPGRYTLYASQFSTTNPLGQVACVTAAGSSTQVNFSLAPQASTFSIGSNLCSTTAPSPPPSPSASATASSAGGGGGGSQPTPPAQTSVGSSGAPVVAISSTSSASGGTQVVGAAGANTGVADLPPNVNLAAFINPSGLTPPTPGTPLAPPIDPSSMTGNAPAPITASVSSQTGGIIIAGNAAILVPPQALANVAGGQATFAIKPATNVPVPGGPTQFSPNGTVLEVSITDKNGAPVTTFPIPIPIVLKYNAADVGQAKGNLASLTAAYVIDALSPAIENPLHFPAGTFVLFAPQYTSLNTQTGTLTVTTQAIGSTISVVTNPVGYVETLTPNAPELSSFDPGSSQTFGTKAQFSPLQVVEPQIGSRLLVLDPDTGNYSYVNASDVAPSGPPPGKSSAAVVRGLLDP